MMAGSTSIRELGRRLLFMLGVFFLLQGTLSRPVFCQDFSCPVPLAIPDAWEDLNGNGEYDENEPYDPVNTGYDSDDVGQGLMLTRLLTFPTPHKFGVMYPVDFPALNRGDPLQGAEWFGKWLVECSPYELAVNDSLSLASSSPADTLMGAFISFYNQDPSAYWDEVTQSVQSEFAQSPRIITVLAYDPTVALPTPRSTLILTKFLSLFVESVGPGYRFNTRIVDAGFGEPVPIIPATWGSLKNKY